MAAATVMRFVWRVRGGWWNAGRYATVGEAVSDAARFGDGRVWEIGVEARDGRCVRMITDQIRLRAEQDAR